MKTINCSIKDEYYTQRNNRKYPFESCFSTSMITKLANQKIFIIAPDGEPIHAGKFQAVYNNQPEDYLTDLLCSKEAREFYKERYKREPKNDTQRFNYRTIAWVTNNLLCKAEVVEYKKNISIREILLSTLKGIPVVIGGKFTKAGHIVCVVGFETEQEDILFSDRKQDIRLELVSDVIIDDPFGKYPGYTDFKGNDIKIPVNIFNQLTGGKFSKKFVII